MSKEMAMVGAVVVMCCSSVSLATMMMMGGDDTKSQAHRSLQVHRVHHVNVTNLSMPRRVLSLAIASMHLNQRELRGGVLGLIIAPPFPMKKPLVRGFHTPFTH